MFHIIVGPLLFALGMVLIYAAVHGFPHGVALPRLTLPRRQTQPGFGPGDTLVGEMLSEMLTLREQVAALQEQVGTIKGSRPRKAPRAA